MATQGQIRARAVAAVRQCRRAYRQADSAGEKFERELDRLVKRKTLISPDSLTSLGNTLLEYSAKQDKVADSFRDLYIVISGTVQI